MRKDFHKVIIEVYRRGGRFKFPRATEMCDDIDEFPAGGKIGVRRPHIRYRKEQADNLSPLRRYLHSKIGENWDNVWSEISSVLKGNGTLQDHVKGHVFDLITINTVMIDGEVWEKPKFGHYSRVRGLYVHPETKIVCDTPPGKSRKKKRAEREEEKRKFFFEISDYECAIKVNGLWHYFKLEDLPKTGVEKERVTHYEWESKTVFVYDSVLDVYLNKRVARPYNHYAQDLYSHEKYAKTKRILGKRELKKYGLKNVI
jgi:hypothetical protein